VKLSPEQRQAALNFLATVDDNQLASLTWQSVGYYNEAAVSQLVREVAAVHCANVVKQSLDTIATNPDPEVRQQAQDNVTAYSSSAKRFTPAEMVTELVGAQ
jgi:hypothetical protein